MHGEEKKTAVADTGVMKKEVRPMKKRISVLMVKMMMVLTLLVCIGFGGAALAETAEIEIQMDPPEAEQIIIEESMDSDEAAEGYIQQKMTGISRRVLLGDYTGSKLTGMDAWLYNALKSQIQAVAAGTRSDTIFTFTPEQIYGKATFGPADLGVDAIWVNNGGNWSVTAEAKAAVNSLITTQFDGTMIFRCLLADCPYELYWFDKLEGNMMSYPSAGYALNQEYPEGVVTLSGNVSFYFAVSEEYRANGSAPVTIGGKDYYCHVGTQWGQSVSTAVANARAIKDRHAGKSDYEKLTAYKDEICTLVDYNYAAASDSPPYGNPWQMIWVFDGDPETKVVCEGYSKAFQFLCDESRFNGNVYSILVSGNMSGATGAGRHMWNVVSMDDGKKYLADITNSDAGSAGQDGELFLTGYYNFDSNQKAYIYLTGGDSLVAYQYGDESTGLYSMEDLVLSDTAYSYTLEATIELNTAMTVEIDLPGAVAAYAFTPTAEGMYRFQSYMGDGSITETMGFLMDSDKNPIVSAYPDTDGKFCITHQLNANTKYYFAASLYDEQATGIFLIRLDHLDAGGIWAEAATDVIYVQKDQFGTAEVNAFSTSGGLTYQWFDGDNAIDGATERQYTFPAPEGSKVYRCVVADAAGHTAEALVEVRRETRIYVTLSNGQDLTIPGLWLENETYGLENETYGVESAISSDRNVIRINGSHMELLTEGDATATVTYSNGLRCVYQITVASGNTLVLPNELQVIETDAFNGDTGVQFVQIDENVGTVASGVFANIGSIQVTVEGNNTSFTGDVFSNSNVAVICHGGSTAEEYCRANEIPYFYIWEE